MSLKVAAMHSLLLATLLFCPPPCSAGDQDAFRTFSTPRFTLHIGATKSSDLGKSPYVDDIADEAILVLNNTFEELTRVFGSKPTEKVTLRFLTPDEFYRATGSPTWTSAMYFGGEISVPLNTSGAVNLAHLKRALRHEYVHAVVAELSGSKCPAWLDEGLAQLIEGEPNALLGPALRRWTKHNEPLPLDDLQNGFTLLDDSLVPTAYAESLFATRTLVNSKGFGAIREYLSLVQQGLNPRDAFLLSFNTSQENFETQLASQIERWASSVNPHP